jgi:hypothetical protein
MRFFLRSCAVALSALIVPVSASAAGITYDCDTAAGHFSDLLLPAPNGPFTVTGNIQVNRIAQDPKWAPLARVRIGSAEPAPGAAPDDYAGIEVMGLPGKELSLPFETVQAFSFDLKGEKSEVVPKSIGAIGAPLPFRISFDGQSVSVNVAGESRTHPMKTGAPVVEVLCSTGEFLFTNLTIQRSQ